MHDNFDNLLKKNDKRFAYLKILIITCIQFCEKP